MRKATVLMDRDFAIGHTDPRLFGAFVEHLGRCVYGGIYEPGHPTADEKGFRQRRARPRARARRRRSCAIPAATSSPATTGRTASARSRSGPRRLDLAWFTTEPNTFGTNEFMDWCKAAERRADARGQPRHPRPATPRATSSSTATIRAAPTGPTCAREHGWEEPHDVKFWCLGNEMDGPWQMGHKTATEYGRVAKEAAKMMRWIDPTHRARRLRLLRPQHADLRRAGRTRSSSTPSSTSTTSRCTPTSTTTPRTRAAFLACPDLMDQLHRGGGGHRRRRRRAPPLEQAHHAELRRVERLVPHAPQARGPRQGGLAGRAADPGGDLQHGGCAGLRRRVHLAAQPRRPREDRLPRPARQRHRADHDRDRRPGLAPDHLPPLRADEPARPRQGAADAGGVRDLRRPRYYDPRGAQDLYFPIPPCPI